MADEIIENEQDQPSLLLVDDDEMLCRVLSQAMEKRGFDINVAHNVDEAIQKIDQSSPEYAVIDLDMPGASGLTLVEHLKAADENTRIVILTGYASIATAVEAVKLGAIHYLAKPADADEIVAALHKDEGDASIPITSKPMSINRLTWEHIQKVLNDCDGNISVAARRMGMHRRTLQRKLRKRPARE